MKPFPFHCLITLLLICKANSAWAEKAGPNILFFLQTTAFTWTDTELRLKHRDEGLVLVEERTGDTGRQKLIERTKKFFFFKQYANFVLPGYRRVEVSSSDALWNSAFQSPDGKTLVVISINASKVYQAIEPIVPGKPVSVSASQTDPSKNCNQVSPSSPIPPKSIRTFVYKY